MDNGQDFGWLQEILTSFASAVYPEAAEHRGWKLVDQNMAKAAIQAHFTAQAEQLPSVHTNDVNGVDCPACGHPTLMLMSGNYITCCMADCPNPDYTDALAMQQQAELLRARIDELGTIQLVYGHYMAQTNINGVWLPLNDRLTELQAELDKLENNK